MAQRFGRTSTPLENLLRSRMASFSTKPARQQQQPKQQVVKATSAAPAAEAVPTQSFLKFQDLKLPGSRLLYLTEQDNQIPTVTIPFLQSIIQRVQLYSSNTMVEAIGFESKTPDHFCRGIDAQSLSKQEQRDCLLQLRDLHQLLSNPPSSPSSSSSSNNSNRSNNNSYMDGNSGYYGRPEVPRPVSLVAYDGEITDAGLTVFWGAKHRLASHKAKFRVAALKEHGKLPLGGVASALVRRNPDNIAMARYLALSGARLNIVDLLDMELVHQVASEKPLLPLFRHLAQSPHFSELSKRQQPNQVDIHLLEEALNTMAIAEPEIFQQIEDHPIWESVLMVPPSAANTPNNTKINNNSSSSSSSNNSNQTVYPEVAGNSWEELQALEKLAPDLLDASVLPGGLSARFEHIDVFVENCFGVKQDAKSAKRTLQQYIANLESQVQHTSNHHHHHHHHHNNNSSSTNNISKGNSSSSNKQVYPSHMMDKRHATIALQRKLAAAKSCFETLSQQDPVVVQTWFDLTRHASTKSFDDCLRDEITLMK